MSVVVFFIIASVVYGLQVLAGDLLGMEPLAYWQVLLVAAGVEMIKRCPAPMGKCADH